MEVRTGEMCHGTDFYSAGGELTGPVRIFANAKERDRTNNVNTAFSRLRRKIPTQPADRKLSKIETLRLACSYITHLDTQLAAGNVGSPCMREAGPANSSRAGQSRCTFCLAEQRLQKREAALSLRTPDLAALVPAHPARTAYGSVPPDPGHAMPQAGAGVRAATAASEPPEAPFGFCPVTSSGMFYPGMANQFAQHEFGR